MSTSSREHREAAPQCLQIAIVTVSDTRNLQTDKSGQLLQDAMSSAGHRVAVREIVPDEAPRIRETVQQLCRAGQIDAVLVTGGTGVAPRDVTPEAIEPLFEVSLPGFGEIFRWLSYEEIGAAAMLSRATAGRVGSVLVFCLPGSTAAVRLAAEKLLCPELPHLVHHARG